MCSVTQRKCEPGESRRYGKDPVSLLENALDGVQTRSDFVETRSVFMKR